MDITAVNNEEAILPLLPSGFYRSRIYTASTGINPLIVAGDPILTLVAHLKNTEYPPSRDKFLANLTHEIKAFEHHAQIANYPENTIIQARYALCCLLDETIALTSEWGKNNGWLHNNLLSIFHNENYGGEYFFTIINNSLENTSTNLHLIELLYLCLSFGFAGKHRYTEYGKSELASITNNLYQTISQYRRMTHRSLLVHDPRTPSQSTQEDYQTTYAPPINTTKLFGFAVILGLIISGVIYLGIHLKLHHVNETLYHLIKHSITN